MKVRLQRYLADCGIASRRECEEMILAGRVQVNGQVRSVMPVMIDPDKDIITADGQLVTHQQKLVYYILNKPKGILVTNNDPADRKTVGELMTGVKERVFPVGRLDMDSRGLLVMTNDGELANRLTHPRHGIEKTYIVETDGRLGAGEVEKIKRGMWLGPEYRGQSGATKTERFRVKVIGRERGRTILEVKISEGKNREIRRVMARVGHPVRDLNRVAIAGKITIKGLDVGEHRPLTDAEVKWLFYASSEVYHEKMRSSTQKWYEEKEMAKERKRLAAEETEGESALPAVHRPGMPRSLTGGKPVVKLTGEQAAEERRKKREERAERRPPVRKGKKPFVPPTGRNAGVPLGGSKKNRLALLRKIEEERGPDALPPTNAKPENTNAFQHPLGGAAKSDE